MTRKQNQRGGLIRVHPNPPALRKQKEDVPLFTTVLKNSGLALLSFFASGLLLITAMTFFAYAQPDPDGWVGSLSLIALLVSAFAAGFISVKRVKEAPLLCGTVTGAMITLTMIALSLILHTLRSSGFAFWQSALLHGACVLFCIMGAFAGNVRKKVKPGKRRFG